MTFKKLLHFVSLLVSCLLIGARVDAQDNNPGWVTPGPSMHVPRSLHSATLLDDGRVLIVGGMIREGELLQSAELFDPATDTFSLTGTLVEPRLEHNAMRLLDGKVLIAGGWGSSHNVLDSAELYNPLTGKFTETNAMTTPRSGFTATLLNNGQVLMVGGYDNHARAFLSSAELFDPVTETFTLTGSLHTARFSHTATLLSDGRVLIAGGGTFDNVWRTAEIYDPEKGVFEQTGEMAAPRYKHAAALLPDGRVLLIGGSNENDWRSQYDNAELYDTSTGTFTNLLPLKNARFKLDDAIALLKGGSILIAGGSEMVEVYDPDTGFSREVAGNIDTSRYYATATTLRDNRVLIAGGYDSDIMGSAGVWLFNP